MRIRFVSSIERLNFIFILIYFSLVIRPWPVRDEQFFINFTKDSDRHQWTVIESFNSKCKALL